jgi:hypothetical protein
MFETPQGPLMGGRQDKPLLSTGNLDECALFLVPTEIYGSTSKQSEEKEVNFNEILLIFGNHVHQGGW